MGELHFQPASELCALLAKGEVSSVELLDHFLRRVESAELGGRVNAVVALDVDRARRRATEADAGLRLSPRCGVDEPRRSLCAATTATFRQSVT